VSATGPWQARGTKGSHIAVQRHRIGNRSAVTLISPLDERVMFVIPGGDQAIIGTTDTFTTDSPDDVAASEADVEYLLASANAYFPDAKLKPSDVVAAWSGIRPLASAPSGIDPSSISREHHIDVASNGVITASGGKLTTYRSMAEEAVDHVMKFLGVAKSECRTAHEELPGGDRNARRAALEASNPELARSVLHGLPYTCSDVALAANEEMAVTITDVMVRRTHIAFELSDHGIATAHSVGSVMADALDWNDATTRSRIADYTKDVKRLFSFRGSS
jgi:glycerol-3-phosphate dehydrogenase